MRKLKNTEVKKAGYYWMNDSLPSESSIVRIVKSKGELTVLECGVRDNEVTLLSHYFEKAYFTGPIEMPLEEFPL